MAQYKVVMVGGGGVGKSAISIQNHFVIEYDPTIEDSYIDDEICIVEVLDTAGQEEYSAMREQWIRYGEGFFVVYSITNRSSFEKELAPLFTQITRVRDVESISEVPVVLFGNKTDLESQRQIATTEGQEKAETIGAAFFEGSAKEYVNLNEAYFEIVRRIRASRHGRLPSESGGMLSLAQLQKSRKEKRSMCLLL